MKHRNLSFLRLVILQQTLTAANTDGNTMGGDGGVIASNRKFMRGAGKADNTGDRNNSKYSKEQQTVNAAEVMTTCALTKVPLHSSSDDAIVACSYGRLYLKEPAVQALLRRKTHDTHELGSHIRGLSDLHNVRFHKEKGGGNTPMVVCPVTGKQLNGSIPAVLLLPGNPDASNVLSERAFSQLPESELEAEYGPIKKRVKLAPPLSMLDDIKAAVAEEQAASAAKRKKKSKRKREESTKRVPTQTLTVSKGAVASANARSKVDCAVQSNSVLSSLFTTNDRKMSEKEKKDSLFAR